MVHPTPREVLLPWKFRPIPAICYQPQGFGSLRKRPL
jgi:hypothetical protein